MYQNIKKLRKEHHLSQIQLANYLGCSQRIYSNYERGEVDIPTKILIKLSDFYGTSIDYLLGRE